MVGLDTPKSRLTSPTVATPPLSRSTMSRRSGCARALNVSLAIVLTIYADPYLGGDSHGGAQDRHAGRVEGGARRAAEGREGAHPPRRRADEEAPGAALGGCREAVRVRRRGRREDARGALRRQLPAGRLPLHV